MTRSPTPLSKTARAHSVFVRLVLPPYTIHFQSPTYLQPTTLDLLDKKVCKETLKSTAQSAEIREAIGTDTKFWLELAALLKAAIPSLERRSFSIWDPTSVDYESTSGALIAANYPGLWKDLERLNDVIGISRNVLTIGKTAQDLAADSHPVDSEIFRLINCCVRVTARGYDGDAGTGEEEKWQWIVNAYKKLLITSLQFLNNLVAQNERRKLMLWVSLFDSTADLLPAEDQLDDEHVEVKPAVAQKPVLNLQQKSAIPPINSHDILLAYGSCGENHLSPLELEGAVPLYSEEGFLPLPPRVAKAKKNPGQMAYVYYTHHIVSIIQKDYQRLHGRSPTLAETHLSIPRYWYEAERTEPGMWTRWQKKYEIVLKQFREEWDAQMAREKDETALAASTTQQPQPKPFQLPRKFSKQEEDRLLSLDSLTLSTTSGTPPPETSASASAHPGPGFQTPARTLDAAWSLKNSLETDTQRPSAEDMRMPFTAEAGSKILESGKAELMKRLEGYSGGDVGALNVARTLSRSKSPLMRVRSSQDPRRNLSDPVVRRPSGDALLAGDGVEEAVAFAEESLESDLEDDEEDEDDDDLDDEEDDEDDEEDYPGSTEDGRGLLTDVPLILGPSEIEVLPMLIMSGLVPANPSTSSNPSTTTPAEETNALHNTHTIRTHLLLSQTSGRNLLRELLIFVAAWDLREEELYFKFMVKILEAILRNGLMPYAYHAFRDRSRSKDIISPAQAVIMKLLTCIFRGRSDVSRSSKPNTAKGSSPTLVLNPSPSKVDLQILSFIFTEFRQHIIPQTCALIFLQGQIHRGRAGAEDFPLNLWDMERMYEGVYQYLEFFAVLTEEQPLPSGGSTAVGGGSGGAGEAQGGVNGGWKSILADWEMASELVTLLRELESGIPKLAPPPHGVPGAPPATSAKAKVQPHQQVQALQPVQQISDAAPRSSSSPAPGLAPVAVERPFELDNGNGPNTTLPPLPLHPPGGQGQAGTPIFEPETPLAYPSPTSPHQQQQQHPQPLHADADEPSSFTWRNLKKLTVLVLSSLLWKNTKVQDQVRECGGLEALVGCCRSDENNPYIREHAIMCLRFAVEGNERNGSVIRAMAEERRKSASAGGKSARRIESSTSTVGTREEGDVPREVLDTNGYETFMDERGQVGLRRKDQHTAHTHAGKSHTGVPKLASTAKISAEKAAELMQNALRDLPLGIGGAGHLLRDEVNLGVGGGWAGGAPGGGVSESVGESERRKAEALERLDREFEREEEEGTGRRE